MTLDVQTLDHILLVGTGVLLVAILAVRLSVGAGLPSLLVYLLMGVLSGSPGSACASTTRRSPTRSASPRSS